MRIKSPIDKIKIPFRSFIDMETSAGGVLIVCTLIAMIIANSPLSEYYFSFLEQHLSIEIQSIFKLNKSFSHWINDGLMCIFFFLIGLEIKKEMTVGELNSIKKSALPVLGALGGMLCPALFYTFFNYGTDSAHGWGIPMATDIAFTVGVLVLLGNKVSTSTKVFLTALAVIDDLGAVIVIAVFYTDHLSAFYLISGIGLITVSALGNWAGVRNFVFYLVIGIFTWILFIKSGVHATIAGVLLAFTIPTRTVIHKKNFLLLSKKYLNDFETAKEDVVEGRELLTYEQQNALHYLEEAINDVESPLHQLEHMLKNWVGFFIIPIFVLANAGVELNGNMSTAITHPVTLGIMTGLFLGKQIGVFSFCWIAIKLGMAQMIKGSSWIELYGASLLAGIGFTMSLFINGLAFTHPEYMDYAKIGILAASLLSGLTGFFVLYIFSYAKK